MPKYTKQAMDDYCIYAIFDDYQIINTPYSFGERRDTIWVSEFEVEITEKEYKKLLKQIRYVQFKTKLKQL